MFNEVLTDFFCIVKVIRVEEGLKDVEFIDNLLIVFITMKQCNNVAMIYLCQK